MKRTSRVCLSVVYTAVLIAAALVSATSAAAKVKPRIVAAPSTVKLGESTMLTGKGFPANTELELQECPQHRGSVFLECAEVEVLVTTGPGGEFAVTFPVEPCPKVELELGVAGAFARQPKEKCFIGSFEHAVDTWRLRGAVKVKLLL